MSRGVFLKQLESKGLSMCSRYPEYFTRPEETDTEKWTNTLTSITSRLFTYHTKTTELDALQLPRTLIGTNLCLTFGCLPFGSEVLKLGWWALECPLFIVVSCKGDMGFPRFPLKIRILAKYVLPNKNATVLKM